MRTRTQDLERRIRRWMVFFIGGLMLSGLTAFPLETETRWLCEILRAPSLPFASRWPDLVRWVETVHVALVEIYGRYPFLAYGTDWLAFAHLVIALAFVGPYRDPVRNVWIIEWGIWACAGVVPLALVCGAVRGIPFFWQAIDMSFGFFGVIPLILIRRDIDELERSRAIVAAWRP